jgi:dienelactone hydrolase
MTVTRNVENRPVQIALGPITLDGDLAVPPGARGVVLFAHGSGSSRKSPRNRQVAAQLQQAGLATLLMDLLTAEEEEIDDRTRALRFDISLLAERLGGATDWLIGDATMKGLLAPDPAAKAPAIGYFGASTGSAAALIAASARPANVRAVVSRGGRPDLATAALHKVKAPTLLIVGGNDREVLKLNQDAYARLRCKKEIAIVPGATHLFEEPGALEQVASLAQGWFEEYLKM